MRLSLGVALMVMLPVSAVAQETRTDAIAAAQAEKAAQLAPQKVSWAEELYLTMRGAIVLQPAGLYPYFDTVYSGGGFTLGAGYRYFTGDRTHLNVAGLYSGKGYKLIETGAESLGHWSGRLDLRGNAGWRDATQVSYHGLGIESPAAVETAYRMKQAYAGGDLTAHPIRWLRLTAGLTYEDYTVTEPTGDEIPVGSVFTGETAPGLGVNPAFVHSTVAAGIDSRPAVDYARRGAFYQVTHHWYTDRDAAYSFRRLDVEAVQHIPILRENWVISLRGRVQSTMGDDVQVPYFMMPALGGGSTLRGFSSWRFRDRHAALAQAEWRWMASRLALDVALFVDAGVVAPRFSALTANAMVNDVGIGARFHGPARTPLRVELAHSSEGWRLVFSSSAAF